MKGKNLRLWVSLSVALLLVLAFVGYWYFTKGRQVTAPANAGSTEVIEPPTIPPTPAEAVKVEEVTVGVIDMNYLRSVHPKVKTLDQLEDQIRGYLKEQSKQQTELKTNQQQLENQYADLGSELQIQVEGIQNKYQQMIDSKVEVLQQELSRFEEKTWKDAMAQIERKQVDLQAMAREVIESNYAKQALKLAEVDKALNAQYSSEILNLRMKLQMIQLKPEEQKQYTDRLEKIQVEQQEKLEAERVKLDEEATRFIEEKQIELDKEMKTYQEQVQREVEAALQTERARLDSVLQTYIKEMEGQMQSEIDSKQKRLNEQTRTGLNRVQQEIAQELKKHETLLSTKIADTRKKQEGILQEIDEDIKAIVARIAEDEQLDVVLTDIRVNVDAKDLTEQVLKKLNQ